jgi:hypothetical protein
VYGCTYTYITQLAKLSNGRKIGGQGGQGGQADGGNTAGCWVYEYTFTHFMAQLEKLADGGKLAR